MGESVTLNTALLSSIVTLAMTSCFIKVVGVLGRLQPALNGIDYSKPYVNNDAIASLIFVCYYCSEILN